MGTVNEKLSYLHDTKHKIRKSIENKGVYINSNTPFSEYSNKIDKIGTTKDRIMYSDFLPIEDMNVCKEILREDDMDEYIYKGIFLLYDLYFNDFSIFNVNGDSENLIKTCDGKLYGGEKVAETRCRHYWDEEKCLISNFNGQKIHWYIEYSKTENTFLSANPNGESTAYICFDNTYVSSSLIASRGYYAIDGINGATFRPTYSISSYTGGRTRFLPDIDCLELGALSYAFSGSSLLELPRIFNTQNFNTMNGTFSNCILIEDIPRFDTSQVIYMMETFSGCLSLRKIPNLDYSKVINFSRGFKSCSSISGDITLDLPQAEILTMLFSNCIDLKSIKLTGLNSLLNTSYLCNECSNLLSFSCSETPNLQDCSGMFYGCNRLRKVGKIDMTNVINATDMFGMCSRLIDIDLININCSLDLKDCVVLPEEQVVKIINNLLPTESEKKLRITDYMFNYGLTDEQKKIATDKGWTLTV